MRFFDNFIHNEAQDKIEHAMFKMPWYFNTVDDDIKTISNDNAPYFVNLLGCEAHGTTADDIRPFVPLIIQLEKVTGKSYSDRIVRVKANLYTKRNEFPEDAYHKPHLDLYNKDTDLGDEGEIFLYYVNTADGDTFFFNEKKQGQKDYTINKRVPHIKGTAMLFDNTIVHASSSPRFSEYRMNINFVFKK